MSPGAPTTGTSSTVRSPTTSTPRSGSHNFKVGGQASREYIETRQFKSGDAYGILEDGVPTQINISRTPRTSHQRLNTWAFYAQDAWTIGDRLTLNIGVRLDGIYGYVPVQSSPAGTWAALSEQLSDAVFEVTSEIGGLPDWPMNVGPRLSFAYDLFGDGRAALKGGWGRYYTQTGSALSNSANPNAGASANVGWNDLDGDKLVDIGPVGHSRGQPRNRPLRSRASPAAPARSTTRTPTGRTATTSRSVWT